MSTPIKSENGTAVVLVASASAPGNAVISSGARSDKGAEWDNATDKEPECDIVFSGTFASAPTAGQRVSLYLLPSHDGTNYPAGDASNAPSQSYLAGIAYVRNATAALLHFHGPRGPGEPLRVPACKLKAVVYNETGQQISTGWTLTAYPRHYAAG